MTPIESIKSLALSIGADVLENEPMERHTTFKIGGPADIFITPQSEDALISLCGFCAERNYPYFIIGNGSNLLFSDKGFRGAVIKTGGFGEITANGEKITSPSGAKLSSLCEFARENGLQGIEFAYGIPGTVGGAVYMNAGAYGGEMKDVVLSSTHIDGSKAGALCGGELRFGYRKSAYTGTKLVITKVEFGLHYADREKIGKRMQELMERRRLKQPLDYPSAGSVFKRPTGHFAGPLIEQCGLKGVRVGGAMVSEKHAGFIVNVGGATCRDVMELVDTIKSKVYKETGVELECEIKIAGEI